MTTLVTLVSVNGILQSTSMYMETDVSIIFHQAPDEGSTIDVILKDNRLTYKGNGTNCVFNLPHELTEELQFKQFMHNAWLNRDNPTVRDQLEKLKIVMELVR